MNRKQILLIAIALAFVLTAGTYAYTFGTTTSTSLDVIDAGGDIARIQKASYEPDWYSVTAGLLGGEEENNDDKGKGKDDGEDGDKKEEPKISGEVPTGDLFLVDTHPSYPGDLLVRVYLTNTGDIIKAYQYLNMKLYLTGSTESQIEPFYLLLSPENGMVTFNLEGGGNGNPTISIVGGSYRLQGKKPDKWEEGWTVVPEFYAEVLPR
ncbi:MAG: hypothetical protein KKF26_01000 [Chloroflexi bacterium]|nr:hypothetical protein [Chloroflexota bacterium]